MVQNPQVFPCQYQKSEGSEVEKKALEEIYASQAKLRKSKDEARRFNKCQMHCLWSLILCIYIYIYLYYMYMSTLVERCLKYKYIYISWINFHMQWLCLMFSIFCSTITLITKQEKAREDAEKKTKRKANREKKETKKAEGKNLGEDPQRLRQKQRQQQRPNIPRKLKLKLKVMRIPKIPLPHQQSAWKLPRPLGNSVLPPWKRTGQMEIKWPGRCWWSLLRPWKVRLVLRYQTFKLFSRSF